MKIEGRLQKIGKFWAVEIPLLLIHTQGRSKKDALEMAEDAVETIIDRKGFRAKVSLVDDARFVVGTNDDQALFAMILRQQRGAKSLSIREVAARLGSRSPTAYARYESGGTTLSIDKFTEILQAIDADAEPVLTLERKHG